MALQENERFECTEHFHIYERKYDSCESKSEKNRKKSLFLLEKKKIEINSQNPILLSKKKNNCTDFSSWHNVMG